MSFRKKRNAVVSSRNTTLPLKNAEKVAIAGTRPSPLDGRLTISTGTRSLDVVLGGHAGLALGTSTLVEESGTTDFGGALLRHYAAEGVVHGHFVHALGMNEAWGRELPGLTGAVEASPLRNDDKNTTGDKMKIAWRYERLEGYGRGGQPFIEFTAWGLISSLAANPDDSTKPSIFCHDFDLSKRLALPSPSVLKCVPLAPQMAFGFRPTEPAESPFTTFVHHLISQLSTTPPSIIHRIVIPSLLSPAIYPYSACAPEHVLQFLHSLRALLRKHPNQLTALITLPLALHPRTTGLTRWIEMLSDGVLELAPISFLPDFTPAAKFGSATGQEEVPQGILKVHRLPIFHEKGGSGGEWGVLGDDLAFTLSRRKGLVVKPFSLPPVDGHSEAQNVGSDGDQRKATMVDIDF